MVDSYTYLFLGILTVGITAFDFFYTTLSFNGAGVLNKSITTALSHSFLWMNNLTPTRVVMRYSGLTQILLSCMLWIGMLWLGFFLLLHSSNTSVVHASSGKPADALDKLYFCGYVLSTLGNGEFRPGHHVWQLVVDVFSFSGFIFISTGMSYLLNLTSAVLHKRSLALYISNIGKTPEEIITHTYSKGNFNRLINIVPSLHEKINRHDQNHLAYPITHYFYSYSHKESFAVNLCRLDEALNVALHCIDTNATWQDEIRPLRNAIHNHLDTVRKSFIAKQENYDHVTPDMQYLKQHDIKLTEQHTAVENDNAIQDRRALLTGYLKSSGWNWDDVYTPGDD